MAKKIPIQKWIVMIVMIALPISIVMLSGWYFGFFTQVPAFKDPCLGNFSESTCVKNKMCGWNEKAFSCNLKSQCTGSAQQNCGEGCHWDATQKRPNSNLYGICRPAFYDETADPSSELK